MITQQMVVLFLLLAVGYLAHRAGLMDAAFDRRLTALVLNITTPALILSSVMGGERMLSDGEVLLLLLLSLATFVLMFLLSFPLSRLFRNENRNMIRFMLLFSNTGFMGYPVLEALFGTGAVFLGAIFGLVFNLLVFTLGVRLVTDGARSGFDRSTLLSPSVIASVLAIVLYFIRLPVPDLILSPLTYLANITTPASMLIIGSSLAEVPFRSIFRGGSMYLLSLLKLIVIPIVFYLLISLLPVSELIRNVLVTMWFLPVATISTMLASQHGVDTACSSRAVLLTTLLSVLTIPLLSTLFFQ